MECTAERQFVIAAKDLEQLGIVPHSVVIAEATKYRNALLAYRRLAGKKFWVPSIERLISVTSDLW